jgi:chromosome segregation ATPase
MSDNSNGLSPEQCLARLRELDLERENLIKRQAALGERHNSAQRELVGLIEKMKELGTSPQTIQADLTKATEELNKETLEYENSLSILKKQLDDADKALEILDQNHSR